MVSPYFIYSIVTPKRENYLLLVAQNRDTIQSERGERESLQRAINQA